MYTRLTPESAHLRQRGTLGDMVWDNRLGTKRDGGGTLVETPEEMPAARRPYNSPELVAYGSITELTLGGTNQVGDGFAGNVGTGTVNPGGPSR